MNKRRHDLSSKIRKTKKSHQLQLKRRHTSSQVVPQDTITNPNECLEQFLAAPSIFSISAIQTSLATSKQASALPLHEIPADKAQQFLNLLLTFLRSRNVEESLHALRIFTNLAAMECPESYYSSCQSWCNFLLSSELPLSLTALLSSENEVIQEQACWVVGNIAGDSQPCRDKLVSQNILPCLVGCLRHKAKTNVLRRNILWAMSNLARGTGSASVFIQAGLCAADFFNILSLEQAGSQDPVDVWDVRKELYWLLAFLISKEDEAIESLVNDQLLLVLSHHFSHVTTVILKKRDRGSIFQSVIPIVRIFGNLSTASDGKYIPGIIAANENKIVHTLATWLQVQRPCGETMTIATEVTWVAGALLCDAGYPEHLSTRVACPVLLPALCRVLLKGTFTLEWKREVLNALWNSLASPPGSDAANTMGTRDQFLVQIYREKGMIRALVGMLVCMDVDAIRPAINMIDAFHRRMDRYDDNALRILEEAECLHALESVCDAATGNASYGGATDWQSSTGGMDYCAEMAANLIDDYYDNNDEVIDMGSSENFEFNIEGGANPVFNFGNQPEIVRNNSNNSDPMMTSSAGRGRGRGRGRNIPAWVQKKAHAF